MNSEVVRFPDPKITQRNARLTYRCLCKTVALMSKRQYAVCSTAGCCHREVYLSVTLLTKYQCAKSQSDFVFGVTSRDIDAERYAAGCGDSK